MEDRNRQERNVQKLQILVTDQEMKVLDDWRDRHQISSLEMAVRELLKRGIAVPDNNAGAAR